MGAILLAALRLMRDVLAGEETELPPWEGWGRLFLDGVRVLVVGIAFALAPALLHWLVAGELLTVLAFGVAATLEPMALVRLARRPLRPGRLPNPHAALHLPLRDAPRGPGALDKA